jgi:hypothetical protein
MPSLLTGSAELLQAMKPLIIVLPPLARLWSDEIA